MFIVLGMYNFDSTKIKREFLLWPASESRFLCQHLSTANPIHSCKLCSIKSFNAHFASHQCLMVYGKRERKANKWLYEKRNAKMINGMYFDSKLFWLTVIKNCSSDWEFSNFLRSLEEFIFKPRLEEFLVTECFFKLFLEVSRI